MGKMNKNLSHLSRCFKIKLGEERAVEGHINWQLWLSFVDLNIYIYIYTRKNWHHKGKIDNYIFIF